MNDRRSTAGPCRLVERVERHARDRPDAPAVRGPDGELSFTQLARRSAEIAAALHTKGVTQETPVAVLLPNSTELVATLLAIWRLGAVFVPLDVRYPMARLSTILVDTESNILVTDVSSGDFPVETIVSPTALRSTVVHLSDATPAQESCAYTIYTSGTTGRPKGVLITYRGLDTFLRALDGIGLDPAGVGINAVSPAFDGWLWCTLLYLLHGQCVTLVDLAGDDAENSSPDDRIAAVAPTTVCLPPSLIAALAQDIPSARVVVVAGEASTASLVTRWAAGRRLLNVYGPTEATIAATWADTARGDDPTTIGRPLPGYRLLVLDDRMHQVPKGEPGQLHIGGDALARGYRNQPGLTAAAFVPDPYSESGGRLYRTGDLVRERADGQLEFIGRADTQVKIRGFRIELGEVERVAATTPGVVTGTAFVTATGVLGLAVVAETGRSADDLRVAVGAQCERQLAWFMRPATVHVVSALPVAPTGKVDRIALADLVDDERAAAPLNERQQQVAELWGRYLAVEVTDAESSFFDLGGHSLLAARMVAELRRSTGMRLTVRQLLANPTVSAFASELDEIAARSS